MMRDARAVSMQLAARMGELAPALLPNGYKQGDYWRVGDLSGVKGSSLSTKLSGPFQARYLAFNPGGRISALNLVKGVFGCSMLDAVAWAWKWLARATGDPPAPKFHRRPSVSACRVNP